MIEIFTLIGLGIVDALNPFSIGAMIYLLATPRPVANGTVFIAGTLLVYLLCGVALMEGWALVLKNLLPLVSYWLEILALSIAGILCLGMAVELYRKSGSGWKQEAPTAPSLALSGIFLFAFVSTLSDLTTAVPYIAAANTIAGINGE
jgi:hypothetical protein